MQSEQNARAVVRDWGPAWVSASMGMGIMMSKLQIISATALNIQLALNVMNAFLLRVLGKQCSHISIMKETVGEK